MSAKPAPSAPPSSGLLPMRPSLYPWLVLLLSLPVVGPLLQPGYFWGAHDARHSVYFLYQFDRAIRDGVFYPRWAPDFAFGYGYPFFNIYGPLSSYAGQLLHWAGLDFVGAVKVVFGLSALLSGLAMYFFVARLLGRPAGLVAALTYVYLPYHLFDLYVRAALAESVGFVFIPLTMWGFYEAVTHPRLPALLWAALAYAGLMFTSNLLALLLTPLLGLYVAYVIVWRVSESENQRISESASQRVSESASQRNESASQRVSESASQRVSESANGETTSSALESDLPAEPTTSSPAPLPPRSPAPLLPRSPAPLLPCSSSGPPFRRHLY